jgi:hypothetical protein
MLKAITHYASVRTETFESRRTYKGPGDLSLMDSSSWNNFPIYLTSKLNLYRVIMKCLASLAFLLKAVAASNIMFYGIEPDIATLQHFSYMQLVYPEHMAQVKGLYYANSTADGTILEPYEYNLDDYEPISKLALTSVHAPRALTFPRSTAQTTCHTGEGKQCNWIGKSDNQNFVCHTISGLAGSSGAVAVGLLVNGITCPKPQRPGKLQLTFQAAWGIGSFAAAAAAIDYCPNALEKLGSCEYDGQVSKDQSDVRFLWSIDNEPDDDTTCAALRMNYGGRTFECREVQK